jgi:hypothetical protein
MSLAILDGASIFYCNCLLIFFLEYTRALCIIVLRKNFKIQERLFPARQLPHRGYILTITNLGFIGINLNYVRAYGAMAEGQRAAPPVIALDVRNNLSRASTFDVDRVP